MLESSHRDVFECTPSLANEKIADDDNFLAIENDGIKLPIKFHTIDIHVYSYTVIYGLNGAA
ncbi:MAG: hypothetical protein QX189_17570 [Methylococcales bacterium]